MQPSLEAARELEQALQQLMGLLDGGAADPRALEQAARACDRGFEALRSGFERERRGGPEGLSQVLRANAIASDLAGRRLEGTRDRLGRVRAARRALRRVTGGEATGESCDVAG